MKLQSAGPGYMKWGVGVALVCVLQGAAWATPISSIHYLAAYQQADVVCFGRFGEIGGYSTEELRAHGGAMAPVTGREFSGTFDCAAVFKGEAASDSLTVVLENRYGYVMFGASEPESGLVLFLKREDDHYRLVDNTPYCAIGAYTAGQDPKVDLPEAVPGDAAAARAREAEGLRLLWEFLKSSYENSTPETRVMEYFGMWRTDLFRAIAELGNAPALKAEQERYLKEKSANPSARDRIAALNTRGYGGDADAFREAMAAYKRKEMPLGALQAVSHTLLSFDQGKAYPYVDTLAEALALEDGKITENVAYALRHGDKDEDIPLLVSLLDAVDERTRQHAVMGLYLHEMDDKAFPITGIDYAPGVEHFHASPELYTNRWKAWWNKYGREKYAHVPDAALGEASMPPQAAEVNAAYAKNLEEVDAYIREPGADARGELKRCEAILARYPEHPRNREVQMRMARVLWSLPLSEVAERAAALCEKVMDSAASSEEDYLTLEARVLLAGIRLSTDRHEEGRELLLYQMYYPLEKVRLLSRAEAGLEQGKRESEWRAWQKRQAKTALDGAVQCYLSLEIDPILPSEREARLAKLREVAAEHADNALIQEWIGKFTEMVLRD